MIRISSRRSLMALTLGLICAAGSMTPVVAQSSRANQASSDVFKAEPVRTYNISFAGGSASEYVATVRQAHQSVNIVELADLSRVILPRIEMHNVSLEQAVSILDGAQSAVIDGVGVRLDVDMDHGGGTAPVFRVTAHDFRSGHQRSVGTTTARIWSVSDLTKDDGGETLLNAIESALALKPAEEMTLAPRVRYHRESGLLMARAYDEDLEAIEGVIVEMMRQSQRRPSESRQVTELRNENKRLKDQIEFQTNRGSQIEAMLVEERDRTAAVAAERDEARERIELALQSATEFKTANHVLEQELQRLMNRIDHLTQQIIDLKVKLAEKG